MNVNINDSHELFRKILPYCHCRLSFISAPARRIRYKFTCSSRVIPEAEITRQKSLVCPAMSVMYIPRGDSRSRTPGNAQFQRHLILPLILHILPRARLSSRCCASHLWSPTWSRSFGASAAPLEVMASFLALQHNDPISTRERQADCTHNASFTISYKHPRRLKKGAVHPRRLKKATMHPRRHKMGAKHPKHPQ